MRGAFAGDIAGSRFERSIWHGSSYESACCVGFDSQNQFQESIGQCALSFDLFHPSCFVTDDTLMTLALMDSLVSGEDFRGLLKSHFRRASDASLFGKYFRRWAAADDDSECGSVGNGAAMRVAPVALVSDDMGSVRELARMSAMVTHKTEDAVLGAEAIAAAVLLARHGESKQQIKSYVSSEFNYELDIDLDNMRNDYRFSSKCCTTIPVAIAAFLQSETHEETIRRAISMGGDTDTIACMAGAIAANFWQVDTRLEQHVDRFLDSRSARILSDFEKRFLLDHAS